jgi:PPP family 3-phenylpropionic acid transporter
VPLTSIPYWRLSGFYFFYFACLGVIVPYWSLYLDWEGFNAAEIGELTAILLFSRIVAPNLWAWLADHSGHRMRLVRWVSFLSIFCFAGIFLNQSYLWIAIVLLSFSFFWNASLPQFEVTTLNHLGPHSHHYSRVRVWGSIGFIVIVIALGHLLETSSLSLIPLALIAMLVAIWLVSLTVPDAPAQDSVEVVTPILTLLKNRSIIVFLVMCVLALASHGPYYTFYTLYLEEYGYSRTLIGQMWAVGVAAEVVLFLFMHHGLAKFGLRNVLLISLLLSALRWVLIACFADTLTILIAAQCLHAASFGTFHAAAIAWVHRHFIGKTAVRGQALYSSMSFGAGGAIGSLLSGYLWLSPGPSWTFLIAALMSFCAFLITAWGLKEVDDTLPGVKKA